MSILVFAYALERAEGIRGNELMKPEIKLKKLQELVNINEMYKQGIITTDEAMKMIAG